MNFGYRNFKSQQWRTSMRIEILSGGQWLDAFNNELPVGFYYVRNVSGGDAGLGFWCPACKLNIRHSCPEKVFHCGRTAQFVKPRWFQAAVPVVRLVNPASDRIQIGDTIVVDI